ncbi:ferredoxin [Paraburkholderia sp. JPY158]|uniref:Ferredoxin n=1 Tax=Paraburkholderia atlantica TaxID=2654982 RepID=A0A7W8V5M8_PARAM|nr:hypothetical protein [Paraburkholderia atlantica]MBB5423954.1 ferredoxin [Paraburkholderia atlantica]
MSAAASKHSDHNSHSNTHQWRRAPLSSLAVAGSVTFRRSARMIDWEEQGSVPQLAEANGIAAPSTCRAGAWGAGAARVLEGSVVYAAETVAEPGPACALLCIAKPDAVGKAGREALS